MMKSRSSLLSSDTYGMVNSALCMVHCLAMPVMVTVGASFLSHPAVELAFIGLAAWAVRSATGASTPVHLKVLLWTMWSIFTTCLLLEDVHELFGLLGLGASAGLIAGHVLNLRTRMRVA
jgi:hypothetical protein